MNQIIPQHVAYPHTFVSQRTYVKTENKWDVSPEDSDKPLNEQLREFVTETGCAVSQVSAPNVNIYSESDDRRVYVTSVSLLYIPAEEGTDDRERDVDAAGSAPDDSEPLGDVHTELEPEHAEGAQSGDGGS